MAAFTHTLSDGLKLQVQLKRSAKKRYPAPCVGRSHRRKRPTLSQPAKLAAWLRTNEPLLRQTLQRAPASSLAHLPDQIWYGGEAPSTLSHPYSTIRHEQGRLLLPTTLGPPQQKAALRRHLQECAAHALLPLLQTHAQKLQFSRRHRTFRRRNLLGRVPQPRRHPPQLAADRRTRFRGRLCVHPRALPPAPPQPQPAILGAGQPPHTAHRRGQTMAQAARAGIICIGIKLRRL